MTLTRKQRKHRQNYLVRWGWPRSETKLIKTHEQFVVAYEKQLHREVDAILEILDEDGPLNDDDIKHIVQEFDKGNISVTNEVHDSLKGIVPTAALLYAEKHYLPSDETKVQDGC